MKNLIALLIALIVSLGLYPMSATVTDLNRTTDTVTFETATGNLFAFRGCEDWQVGDTCAAIMYDNGTEIVTDDVILSVRYAGRIH